jgi:hypothetical protein
MRFNKLRKSLYSILLVCCLLATKSAIGQPTNPEGDPDNVPISGIELLLGAGALFGAKRLLDKRRK